MSIIASEIFVDMSARHFMRKNRAQIILEGIRQCDRVIAIKTVLVYGHITASFRGPSGPITQLIRHNLLYGSFRDVHLWPLYVLTLEHYTAYGRNFPEHIFYKVY